MRLVSIFCLSFFLLNLAFAVNEGAILESKLDQALNKAVAENRIVGTVVVVVHKGKVVYHRAAGFANREKQTLMQQNSVFRLASLTKPIVAAATLALVDQGKINLDDAITKWIPEFRPKLITGEEPVITIRQLLTHTSGLSYSFFEAPNGPYHTAGVADGTESVNFSLNENLKRLASVPLLFPAGVAWQYSISYDVLGEVITRATGKKLEEAVESLVTGPLKMMDTRFVVKSSDRLAVPYANTESGPVAMTEGQIVPFGSGVTFSPARATDENAYASGGSGLSGTALEYAVFLEEIRLNNGKILDPKSTEALTSNQIGDLPVFIAPGCGWSLGFMIVKNPSVAQMLVSEGTFQWSGAYGNTFFVDPKNELTVVALTNTTLEGMLGQFPKDVQAAIYLP